MAKQIPAGLGASISGLPYWTMDTGGYTMQRRYANEPMSAADEEEWARAQRPLVRAIHLHAHSARARRTARARDVTLGNDSPAYNAELKFDRLRYAVVSLHLLHAGWSRNRATP